MTFDPSLQPFRGLCARLSAYYLVDRYPPAGLTGPTEAHMTTDIAEARQLVLKLFPGETI